MTEDKKIPTGVHSSVGGFHTVDAGPRKVQSLNVGWRVRKGPIEGAESVDFDDGDWDMVNVPNGLEILPLEASGSVNYQGEAWYRKRFDVPVELKGKRLVLHFEGVMGKSSFWVNGRLVKEHFGGFLPAIIDVTKFMETDKENVIAVWVDNSDDPTYPPGKPQHVLDFSYFGGIYRDVWLVATDRIHITDPNEVNRVAGGGVLVHYDDLSDARVTVCVDVHIVNGTEKAVSLPVRAMLRNAEGDTCGKAVAISELSPQADGLVQLTMAVDNPHLWHVDDPYLHDLEIRVGEDEGLIDAVTLKIGVRSIEFRGKDGFWLNGKAFDGKLVGVNRHQDYAYVGNAVPNGVHWRDAIMLRQAGARVIRCAHYPQDPSFMDACDALGMFVIIATPGWQFWNDDPIFEERVYSDVRNMVRRDRNRPSVFLWEPILNETNYPAHFAKRVHDVCHEEYPYPGCYTACDLEAKGQECFDVVYSHTHKYHHLHDKTPENMERYRADLTGESRCTFTREWGDCVADWRAQSSPSRVNKGWGERAQLIQAKHYADPDYVYTSYETLWASSSQHVGGTLWHGTDHQRGYHADAFWGGIVDATRQPKYSYYLFRSQVNPGAKVPFIDSDPFVYIAHLVHPTSEPDVVVFSNCDEVRLTVDGNVIDCKTTHPEGTHMPRHPAVFENAFRFYRYGQIPQTMVAEGLSGGRVVASYTRYAWDRRERIALEVGDFGLPLQADGSDFVPVVARIVDSRGEVVRLTDDTIRFSVEGPAKIIGDDQAFINPQKLCFGEAVALIRACTEPGTITVRAESAHPGSGKPMAGTITIESRQVVNPWR